jgi:serine/threonine protein kinase
VGEGAFASVYKVKRKEDGQIYAMKKIKIAKGSDK